MLFMKNTFILFVLACLVASTNVLTASAQEVDFNADSMHKAHPLYYYCFSSDSEVYKYKYKGYQYTTWEPMPARGRRPIGTFPTTPHLAAIVKNIADSAHITYTPFSNADDSIIIETQGYTCTVTTTPYDQANNTAYYKYEFYVPGTEPYSFVWHQDYFSGKIVTLSLRSRRTAKIQNLIALDEGLMAFLTDIKKGKYHLHRIEHPE